MQGVSRQVAGISVLASGVLGVALLVAVLASEPTHDDAAERQANLDLQAQNYDVGWSAKVTEKDGVKKSTARFSELRRTFSIAFVDGKWQPVCRSLDGIDVPFSNKTMNEEVNRTRKCPVGFLAKAYTG